MARSGAPIVSSVRDLGVQFVPNDVHATGFDGATSILLPGDRSLWVFGDTVEGPFDSIRGFPLTEVLSNTAAVVPLQDISDGIRDFEFVRSPDGRRPRQLVEFLPHEDKARHRVWAIHGTHHAGRLYLFYHRITMDPELDVFEAFTLDGMGLARGDETFRFERLRAGDGTYELWKGHEPGFGAYTQMVDGQLYLWGSIQPGRSSMGDMHLARVNPDDIEDQAAYEYLIDAPTLERPEVEPVWSRTFRPTAPLFDHVPNEMSSSWNAHLGAYISLTTYDRTDRLVIRTAPRISGPWSEPETFFRPTRTTPDSLFNAGKEHPEFAREGGRVIYMTFIDSSVYAPHLLEITLA